jgi:hypothetical protein
MSSIDKRKAYHIDPLNGQQNVLAIRTPSSRRSGGAYRQGYRGHNYPNRLKVWTSAQVRCITEAIHLQMKRTSPRRAGDSFKSGPHPMSRDYLRKRSDRCRSPPPASTSVCSCDGSKGLFASQIMDCWIFRLRDSSKRLIRSVASRCWAHHSSSS